MGGGIGQDLGTHLVSNQPPVFSSVATGHENQIQGDCVIC